jgi:4-hydroxy-tetrahydrodipicolinate reductase
VEVIELHHDRKRDSPSGTAAHTAHLIAAARAAAGLDVGPGVASAGTDPARGELIDGVPVHALRLPGASAHQEVVFGSPGELLTIRHDVIDRSAYATGVALAARRVGSMRGLNTGLEHAL